MRFAAPLMATTLIASMLLCTASTSAANRPRWSHIVWTQSHDSRSNMSVTYVTDTPREASAARVEVLGPFEGPEPYQKSLILQPTGEASAIARTRLGFSGDATGHVYPLTLQLFGAGGALATVDVDARVRPADQAADDEGGIGSPVATAEILALEDADGDGAPDAYRVVVAAAGDLATQVLKVAVDFGDPYEGPAPHASALTLPFKVYKQAYELGDIYFSGDPAGSLYTLNLTPLGPDGKALGPAEQQSVKVKADKTPPIVGEIAIRTAPAHQACAGGPEEEGGQGVRCSAEELDRFSDRLAELSELAGLAHFRATRAEADMAYVGGKKPWEWTGSGEILRSYVAQGAAADASALVLDDVILDGLVGLSAQELLDLALLLHERYPSSSEESAFEAGKAMGGGFFLDGLTPVPVQEGEIVFEHQLVVDGYAFDPAKIHEALNSTTPARRLTHPIGLRLGVSKGWESALVDWTTLSTTSVEELAASALAMGAQVAVVVSLPKDKADAERAAAIQAYDEEIAAAEAALAARGGRGTLSRDPVYLQHSFDAQSGELLSLPGMISVVSGVDGALFVDPDNGDVSFIKGLDPAADPNGAVMAHQNGGGRGLVGAWTFDDAAAADASVTYRMGAPANSPDDAKAAAALASERAFQEAAQVEALRRDIAAAKAGKAAIGKASAPLHETRMLIGTP